VGWPARGVPPGSVSSPWPASRTRGLTHPLLLSAALKSRLTAQPAWGWSVQGKPVFFPLMSQGRGRCRSKKR
jgi:hypothetical protein